MALGIREERAKADIQGKKMRVEPFLGAARVVVCGEGAAEEAAADTPRTTSQSPTPPTSYTALCLHGDIRKLTDRETVQQRDTQTHRQTKTPTQIRIK